MILNNIARRKSISLANILTLIRMALIIPMLIFLHNSIKYDSKISAYVAASIFVLASLTDLIDGYIARKHHQASNFGAMIDPLADKLLVVGALIFLIGHGVDAWMVYAILARELLITGLRSLASLSSHKDPMPAKISGKIKTASQMIGILCVMLAVPGAYYIMLGATIITIYSGLEYLWIERKLLMDSV